MKYLKRLNEEFEIPQTDGMQSTDDAVEKDLLSKKGDKKSDDEESEEKPEAEDYEQIEKKQPIKVHAFRYIGKSGDGIIFSKDRSDDRMKSENWQYLGKWELPGGFINQLPYRNEKEEWRAFHKE